MNSAASFIVINETGAMISACMLNLLFAATFLAAPLVNQDSCDYPPRLVSAELMDEYKEKDFFPVGSTVKYKCRPGYMKKAGTYSSTCNRNRQWSKVQELCKRKTCGHPGEPDDGRLLVTGDFDLGSTAHYQCDEGYRMIGKSTRKCKVLNNKMVWTEEVPYCEIIPCSPPPEIPHGKHNGMYLYSFYYGILIKYTCDKGYPLIGNASIYCTSKDGLNGEWSGRVYCGETPCPSPQIKNGRIVAGVSSTYKYNQKVSFECIGGHEMVGSREIHCQLDGTWDPPIPVCEQMVQCPPPRDIQNGTHNNQKTGVFPSGIFVKYTCNPGYALIGEATLHCTNAGRWSSPAPNCEVVQCQPPPDIQNGTRSNQETAVFPSGMLVKYTCNPGYALIGEATIQCIDNGMWSSPAPNCEGGNCDIPMRLDFAELTDEYQKMNSFPVGSLVQYKCNPGYVKHPRMNASSICIRNQVWSEVQEFCKKKSCGHPGEPENGRLIVSGDFLFGSTLSYTCEEGYILIGESSRQCALNGKSVKWSGSLPECHLILCSSPPNIPHSKNTGKYLEYFPYGTTVTYTCDKGYPTIGNASIYCTSKDGITGEWSGQVYCGETQCPSPQIKNGRIVAGVSSTYKYNQKVSFECIGGHKMVGSREIHCQVDGTWDPPIPVCEQMVQCPPPPDIQNGTHNNHKTGVFPSGIFVKYTCNPGYALIGEATLHCTNAGRWSSPAPNCEVVQCQPPPDIQNGTRSNQETAVFPSGMLVKYTCNPGYALIGEATIQCIDNGMWSSPAPNCEGGNCDIPMRLDFAELTDEYQKMNSFPVGSLVQYKCNPGYVKHPRMNASSICIRNQVWSEVQEFCKKKSCGHPGEPENGRLIVSGDFLFGSTLHYTCEEGYILIGESSRQCALNGKSVKWSGSLPECHPILCSSPPNIPHSKNTGKYLEYFPYGTTVTYTCDKGYPTIGNASIYCTSKDGITGEWSGRVYCGETQCPSPQIKNGRIVAGVSSTYKYNQKVSFECIGGHKMVGSREIHCQVDGTWDPPIPVCEQMVQCPPPPDIQNGTHNNHKTGVFPSGIFVKYTCNPGYALIGEATLHCTNAGRWSSPAPNCEGKSCGHPGELEGGRLLATGDFRFGSTVNYQCEEGYKLIGKSSRSCALFGKTVAWAGDLPYCQMTQCPSPQIKNGRIAAGNSSTYKYNQTVSFECIGGHEMVGSREIYCQVDGRWDPPVPICVQVPGCVNPDIQNGRIISLKASDQSVSTITFECDSGYTMKGQHTIRCQRGNTWDSPAPICVKVVQCQPPPDIKNGIHSNQETLFHSGMLVKYTCNPGYVLIGEATIQCMDNGTWSSLAPNCEEIECKSPPDIQNGVRSNQELMVFKRRMCVKYTCNSGYTLIGDATIHCTDSGTWTFPAPHCEKSQCPFPPSITNGKHDGLALQKFTSETSVTYSCDPGYLLIGKASIFCGPSGNWSLPVPSCAVMHCPAPPKVIHGRPVGEDFTYGKSVIYICDAGYSCIGNYSVTCIWNNSNSVKWSEAPRCQGCLAPPNIGHSKRDKTTLEDFPYGTSVTYHCDPGFFLIGGPTIYCQTSGTWNQPVPQCKRREYTEATKLPSDSQVTKDGSYQIEKITGSFIKNTIHSKINKTTTKDLATTLNPGLGGEPDIERFSEQLNGGNQTDLQKDTFSELRNCSGVDGCPPPPLSGNTKAKTKTVIQTSANVTLECENGYVRNDSSPVQAQQIGWDAPVPACTLNKQSSYNFATIGFGSVGSILLLFLIFGAVMWIVLLQKKKRNCTCEAQRNYYVVNYEDSPL